MAALYNQKWLRKTIYDIECAKEYKFLTYFSSYNIKLVLETGAFILIGRGSLGALNNIVYYKNYEEDGCILSIGDFSEFSECEILIGGEHSNGSMFNFLYNAFPMVAIEANNRGLPGARPCLKGPTTIGANVLVSRGSIILSGACIGDGAVIAAGAVVSGQIPELTICGGVPAKVLKPRFSDEKAEIYRQIRWPNIDIHEIGRVGEIIQRYETGDVSLDEVQSLDQQKRETRIVFQCSTEKKRIVPRTILGVEIEGRFTPVAGLSSKFMEYFSQATSDKTQVKWIPDIFDFLSID